MRGILALLGLVLFVLVVPAPLPGSTGLSSPGLGVPDATPPASLSKSSPAFVAPSPISTPSGWTNLTPRTGPAPRSDASFAFDDASGYAVLFGGTSTTGFLNDTWSFRGGTWHRLLEPLSPSARASAAVAYDAPSGSLILFGGFNGAYLADTWRFQDGRWSMLSLVTSPPARSSSGLALDPSDGSLVLFGGRSTVDLSDTWAFRGGGWTPVLPVASPPARENATLSEDPGSGSVVLFGGWNGHPLSDTWTFSGNRWTNATAAREPGARAGAGTAYDPIDGYLLVFGGSGATSFNDTWSLRSGSWAQLSPPAAPSRRTNGAMAFDLVDGAVLLFGGTTATGVSGDLWGFRAAGTSMSFQNVTTVTSPLLRTQAGLGYDPAAGSVLLFGGQNHAGNNTTVLYFGDTWTYRAGSWTRHIESVAPSPRRGSMVAFDPVIGSMILFGGTDLTGYLNDTWEFRGNAWTHLATPVAPPPRRSGALAYDPSLSGLVLYGGHNASGGGLKGWYGVFGDTWLFQAGVWRQLHPANSPGPRAEELVAFDPSESELVMFGGYQQNHSHGWEQEMNSTWAFHNGTWTNLTKQIGGPAPGPRDGAGFVYDPATGYIFLFGGDDNTRVPVNGTWALHNDRWTKVCTCAAPMWVVDHATYDAADGYLFTVGGNSPATLLSTFAWAPDPYLSPSATPNPVDANRPALLTAWHGGGLSTETFQFVLPNGTHRSGARNFVTFGTPGNETIALWENDSHAGDLEANVTVVVAAPLSANLSVRPSSVALGRPVAGAGAYSGGVGPFLWNLTSTAPGCGALTTLSFNCTPSSKGTFRFVLTVTDETGNVRTARVSIRVT
jgi:galactose oxidase-like protein